MSRIMPVELLALVATALGVGVAAVAGVRVYAPNADAAVFLGLRHYVGAVSCALALLIIRARISFPDRWRERSLRGLRIVLSVTIVVFWHFNYKLWAMLLNPARWDAAYYAIDQQLQGVEEALLPIRNAFANGFFGGMQNPYHELFVGLFFVSFAAYALAREERGFERVVTAASFVLVLGGVAYALAPAYGPFIYELGESIPASVIQARMNVFVERFLASDGAWYQGGFFTSALGAMPSLHVAHSLVFSVYAVRLNGALGGGFVALAAYMWLEAVASNWHYWVDIPAGIAIGLAAVWLADRFVRPVAPTPDAGAQRGRGDREKVPAEEN